MKYRLGLDMGATSIGWAVFDMDNNFLTDTGVRIFDDGREDKSKTSLCVKRRNARGARRLVNRRHIKMQEMLKFLKENHLFPQSETKGDELKNLNPYELRAKALDQKLELYEIGRILLQLTKRKGFKSNRKDDKAEGGKLKQGFADLKKDIEKYGARTYGEYLYMKSQKEPNEHLRLKNVFDDNGKFGGGLFPFRETYMEEFDKITAVQSRYYPDILTPEVCKKLKEIIYFQRLLKEAEEGECIFEAGEKRIPKAHPLFQKFRIMQTIVNLTFAEEIVPDYLPLPEYERNKLIALLLNPVDITPNQQGIITFGKIKTYLGLDKKGVFNFERQSRPEFSDKGLLVDTTQNAMNNSKFMKEYWDKFTDEQKGKIINFISRPASFIDFPKTKISIEDEDKLIEDYLCREFRLSEPAAKELLFDIDLEADFGSLSEKAVRKILPYLSGGQVYSEACKAAGYAFNIKEHGHLDKLPYYGEILTHACMGKKKEFKCIEEKFGKINNATVHVALNQARHLINELIDRYGQPYDIAIEYARDLPASTKERQTMTNQRDENEKENQRIVKEMQDKICQRKYNKYEIQKYKIWKSLGKYNNDPLTKECPFTGTPIGISDLLNGLKFQIEHILPFSRTLDDSLDNKVLATVEANRYKDNRTPYEAFHESKDGYNWKEIQQRAKKLSIEQQWRFTKDAMKRFEEKESPIARSLNDTRYMTRLLQEYLRPIIRQDGNKTVQAVVGALTSMVRKAWGLNQYKDKENAEDYRAFHNHHAIDAIIAAAIERSQIAAAVRDLKEVKDSTLKQFRSELPKLRDENVSIEEKKDLKKRIKDFEIGREETIIKQYFRMPKNMNVADVLQRVENLNISHKPSLKDIKQPHSTIGKLHEDTAYGLTKFADDNSLKAIFHTKDKKKNSESEDEENAGNSDKSMNKTVVDYIPMFYDKADKNAYYDAYKAWFMLDGKAKSLNIISKEDNAVKAALQAAENAAVQNLRAAAKKAFKWFIGGGNFCAEIYQINPQNKINGVPTDDAGKWKMEIVSNYNATVRNGRGEDVGYWRYKYPNAKRIMTLRRNDMVKATFTHEQAFDAKFPKGLQEYVRAKFDAKTEKIDVLFRVKKMGDNGICLTPHDIAKEKNDTKSWIVSSTDTMQRYKLRKVHISYTGRIPNAE